MTVPGEDPQSLAVEPSAPLPGATEASASVSPSPTPAADEASFMNAMLRSGGQTDASSSNPGQPAHDNADSTNSAGEPTSEDEDATASEGPDAGAQKLGRRASKAAEAAARIAELEAQLAERDPEKIREQIRQQDAQARDAEAINTQAVADADRYRRLLATPDALLTAEDYQWREDRKELLARYPEVQQHTEATLALERKALEDAQQGNQRAFWADVYRQLEQTMALPGLDDAARAELKQSPWPDQIRIHRAAERKIVEAEYAAIRKENEQLKQDALGDTRAPLAVGMPTSGGPTLSENDYMNGFFKAVAAGRRP